MRNSPPFGEGPLTKARAKLVNRRTLAERARHLAIGQHLILSRGEELHGGRDRPSALADTYEALLGAIFLDGGFEAARDFILREFQAAFGGLSVIPILENPKGDDSANAIVIEGKITAFDKRSGSMANPSQLTMQLNVYRRSDNTLLTTLTPQLKMPAAWWQKNDIFGRAVGQWAVSQIKKALK